MHMGLCTCDVPRTLPQGDLRRRFNQPLENPSQQSLYVRSCILQCPFLESGTHHQQRIRSVLHAQLTRQCRDNVVQAACLSQQYTGQWGTTPALRQTLAGRISATGRSSARSQARARVCARTGAGWSTFSSATPATVGVYVSTPANKQVNQRAL